MKKKVGRPTKFPELNLYEIKKYVSAGLTDVQLCVVLKIGKSTLNRYKHQYPEFWDSLKEWRKDADKRVERSLYERACGYSAPAVKFIKIGKSIVKREYIEHYPPDSTAMIFWLKNRQPDVWREKFEYEHSGEVRVMNTIEIEGRVLQPRIGLN